MEHEFVPAAEAMPEDKYAFAPTTGEFKDVRTFAQQVKHVASVNYMLASGILGAKPPVDPVGENGPDSIKSKADIIKYLKDSFVYPHKAAESVNQSNLVSPRKTPSAKARLPAWRWPQGRWATASTTAGRSSNTYV